MTMPTMWPVSEINAEFFPKASLAVDIGDLLYWVVGDLAVEPASQLADLGSAALMQAAFARLFVGVSNTKRQSTDTTTTDAVRVLVDGIWEFPCDSGTFNIGDYVGASYNTNVLRTQQVAKVTARHLAIGRVVKAYASATTKVKCRILSHYFPGLPPGRFSDIGGCGQGVARTTTSASGDIVVTVDATPSQLIDPNGADRNVTLPAVAQSNGLAFRIVHNGTANKLTIRNPTPTAIGVLQAGQTAWAWCDDTGWNILIASSSASGLLVASPLVGIGYTTGAGGTVTQLTNKSTGVTLNTVTGQITMNNANLTTLTRVSFTLTNSAIGANDTVSISIKSGATTGGTYAVIADTIAAGSCQISVTNLSAGTLGEALVLNYNVIKGAAA